MTSIRALLTVTAAIALVGFPADAPGQTAAKVKLRDAGNKEVGMVEMVQTAHGVLLDVRLEGVPAGKHAFHIHETGKCEPPFESAGGHFNPTGKGHGMMDGDGMHAGDLPNVHMPDGVHRFEVLAHAVTLAKGRENSLLDDDGSAIVIHQGADDYMSDPAGEAGKRIACGIVEAGEAPAGEQP